MLRIVPLLAAASMVVAVSGCESLNRDQFDLPGTWRVTGANDVNLRAMIVNPEDLVVGQSARGSSAILANAAVTRVLLDKIKPLPKVSTGGAVGGGGDGGGGGGGGNTGLGASGGAAQ